MDCDNGDVYTVGRDETSLSEDEEEVEESDVDERDLYWGPSDWLEVRCIPTLVSLLPATLASQAMFSVRWLSLEGGMVGERLSEANVLDGISLFFGGRHSLLRSWLDFMLVSTPCTVLQLPFLHLWISVYFSCSLTLCLFATSLTCS